MCKKKKTINNGERMRDRVRELGEGTIWGFIAQYYGMVRSEKKKEIGVHNCRGRRRESIFVIPKNEQIETKQEGKRTSNAIGK